MDVRIVFVCVMIVVATNCEETVSRMKRSKYYPSPPPGARVYRRPPPFHSKPLGAFSYTPPPNWMDEDPKPRPRPQVSKTQGLGDDDINNLVKYLSKQDLDKIIEFAGEKERERPSKERDNNEDYRDSRDQNHSDGKANLNGPYESMEQYKVDVQNNIGDSSQSRPTYAQPNYQPRITNHDFRENYAEESQISYQAQPLNQIRPKENKNYQAYLNGPYAHHINNMAQDTQKQENTDSESSAEEVLPKPVNLREDNEAQGTSNVAAVARPVSYKVENFGDLPLMDYLSKLDTVSSYHVPHYSITSPSNYGSKGNPHSLTPPPVEPAPHASVAAQQSDAHLKAIKIWTHKSRGAAYTLNNDGTLSVERPLKPKPVYGPY